MRVYHVSLCYATLFFAKSAHVVIDEGELWVFLLNGLVEHVETTVVFRAPVLISNFNVFEREWFWMTSLCAACTPFCCSVAYSVFNGVKAVVQIELYVAFRTCVTHSELA